MPWPFRRHDSFSHVSAPGSFADVGITEEAWEVREEQRTRVRNLQVERAREDRLLKEELNEVLDDSGDAEEDK